MDDPSISEISASSEPSLPKVSILLPNLNCRPFLEDRIRTIKEQIFSDWELIIVDGYSSDGSWEFFQSIAESDSRVKLFQFPQEGIYAGINRCIQLAGGKYIYVATSDDTMTPDCLERMVTALENFPDCDLCHCCLAIIDEDGNVREGEWETLLPAQFFGLDLKRPHIRIAPHDTILYCCLNTVYSSLTQLLIRRSIFERVGLFKSMFGSQGDLEWGIRATAQCNTLHLPATLATWRRHPNQASKDSIIDSPEAKASLVHAVKMGIQAIRQNPDFRLKISIHELTFCYRFEQLERQLWAQSNAICKLVAVLKFFWIRPDVAIRLLLDKAFLIPFDRVQFARRLLAKQKLIHNIKRLDGYN